MKESIQGFFELKGKVAIVTGGNGGIGLASARGLAAAGADIVIAARNEAKSEKAASELKKDFGVKVLCLTVDMKDENQIFAMADKTLEEFGRIDILVANAGIAIHKEPEEMTVAEWDENIDVNLRSFFICAKAVYPAMKKQGGGKIISIGSMTSIFGVSFLPAYGASKGGIQQLTRSLAVAWGKDNIQVNCILPGWINTGLSAGGKKAIPTLEGHVIARTPAGHWGEPVVMEGAAVFLASAASDYVTGVALPVDGGYAVMG